MNKTMKALSEELAEIIKRVEAYAEELETSARGFRLDVANLKMLADELFSPERFGEEGIDEEHYPTRSNANQPENDKD